ncbi:hypothetical protein LUZ60_009513 [Juncus effusus]|nr:hypothetical protein LUZ60_009513 [Juncus effusus]
MSKKSVITVPNLSSKTQPSILKIISKFEGIKEVKFDEKKGTVTVVGSVDPVLLVDTLRKKKKIQANIASVRDSSNSEYEKRYGYQYQDGYEYQDYNRGYNYNIYRPVQYIPVSYDNEPSGCTIV